MSQTQIANSNSASSMVVGKNSKQRPIIPPIKIKQTHSGNYHVSNNSSPELSSSINSDNEFRSPRKPAKQKTVTNANQNRFNFFATPNRFSPIMPEENNCSNKFDQSAHDMESQPLGNVDNQPNEPVIITRPPPIYLRDVIDYFGLQNQLKELIGTENFFCKSSQHSLKIQTSIPDAYRTVIKFLKEQPNAKYHTYQLQEDKPLRIVLRGLHSSTVCDEIKNALEEIGFSIKQVVNVRHRILKTNLPLFFVDLENSVNNKNIFDITSILHTKIKVEEPYKKRLIAQCQNCQDYGHTKSYCGYPSRCVKCGADHSSSSCTKSRETPAKCALCNGNHPANYKGCQIYKEIIHLRNPTKNKRQLPSTSQNIEHQIQSNYTIVNSKPTLSTTVNPPLSYSYANALSGQTLQNNTAPSTSTDTVFQITNFLSDFKALISPLLSLLTTVLSKLLVKDDK